MSLENAQPGEQDHFDLLPFIGIMMCLLGTLLLVTMCMAAINVGAGAREGWVPQPDPDAKIPVLIEWDETNVVWHSESGLQKIEENFIGVCQHQWNLDSIDPDGKGQRVDNQPNPLDPLVNFLETRRSPLRAFQPCALQASRTSADLLHALKTERSTSGPNRSSRANRSV